MRARRRSEGPIAPPAAADREQIRRAFLGLALCHELKQPLHSLNLNVELLSKRLAKKPAGESVDFAGPMSALGRVVDRINDCLEAFTSRAAPDPVPPDPIPIRPLLTEAVERAAERAAASGVGISVQVPDLPPINGHPEQLAVALDALIDNAIRASRPGSQVVVSGTISDDELRLEVSDEGPGMTPEVARRAFEIGFSTWGGSGIGLTVAKFVAYHHAGGFQMSSAPGGGATVAMILPLTDVRD